jgi:hypothetical protein
MGTGDQEGGEIRISEADLEAAFVSLDSGMQKVDSGLYRGGLVDWLKTFAVPMKKALFKGRGILNGAEQEFVKEFLKRKYLEQVKPEVGE